MNKVLNDTRGVVISAGDVISIATNKFGEQGALHDISVVDYIDADKSVIYLEDGEDIDISVYDVLVLPESYITRGL